MDANHAGYRIEVFWIFSLRIDSLFLMFGMVNKILPPIRVSSFVRKIHQRAGIFGGALAAYHLLAHGDCVNVVFQRFLGKNLGRARLYFAVDSALMIGFTLIVGTGLVISTWFNFSLANYTTWLSLHIIVSIITLLTLLLKLSLHWRWIARFARCAFTQSELTPGES